MKILLDTNAYSALMKGRPEVADRVRQAEQVLLWTVVVGELLFGFHNGSRYLRNRQQLAEFADSPVVSLLPITWQTAELFGQISTGLRGKSRPIPTNDIWIAAHSFESGAELLSYDPHFGEVEGLSWVALST